MSREPEETKWNIFARELEIVLAKHNLRIGQLDNRHDEDGILVHPAKVSRLQKSLDEPGLYPTLSPKEIERMAKLFDLSDDEVEQLRAAVMATAVERALMARMRDPETALMAADDVFRILKSAIGNSPRLAQAKDGEWLSEITSEGDADFEHALQLMDQAALALHTCGEVTAMHAKLSYAREAQLAYQQAQACLQRCTSPAHTEPQWRNWHDEAVQQLHYTAELIADLERKRP